MTLDPGSLGTPDPDSDPTAPASFNPLAAVVLGVSAVVAFLALFAIPSLVDGGFTARNAFWIVAGVEFTTAVTAGLSALNLYDHPE